MTLVQFSSFCIMLLQQAPPPPDVPARRMPPPPEGGLVPLDTSIWILLIVAVALILYLTLPRFKKEI
jgi:hypothetical protein